MSDKPVQQSKAIPQIADLLSQAAPPDPEEVLRQLQADAADAAAAIRQLNAGFRRRDEEEIDRLRASNEILRAEAARWRAAAIKLGHKGYLADGE